METYIIKINWWQSSPRWKKYLNLLLREAFKIKIMEEDPANNDVLSELSQNYCLKGNCDPEGIIF